MTIIRQLQFQGSTCIACGDAKPAVFTMSHTINSVLIEQDVCTKHAKALKIMGWTYGSKKG